MSEDDFDPSERPEPPEMPEPEENEQPRRGRRRNVSGSEQAKDEAEGETSEPPRKRRKSAQPPPEEEAEQLAKRPKRGRRQAPPEEEAEVKPEAKPKARTKRVPPAEVARKPPPSRGKWRGGTFRERLTRVRWIVGLLGRYAPVWLLAAILIVLFGPALFLNVNRPPIARFFTPEIQHWSAQITKWAAQYNVNPNLIATIMQIESCGDPFIGSGAGAQGLFQVMPFNFQASEDMTDPETNALRGIGVLQDCLKYSKGDISLAMACYNGGASLLYKSPANWPQETQNYVTWGAGIYNDAVRGEDSSPALDNWLASGGAGLCHESSVALGFPTPQSAIIAPPATNQPTSQPTAATGNTPETSTTSAPPSSSTITFPPLPSAPGLKLFLTPTVTPQ